MIRLRLIAAVILLAIPIPALADETHHTLWVVKGNQNTVYLFGSVHALKLADSDLPPEALGAYANAKALVMEIDLGKVSADGMLGPLVDLGTLPAGQTLEQALGPDAYEKFAARAKDVGLDLALLSHFQPWFAAMTFEQVELARLGFAPDVGVDMQLARRAQADHKGIIGLETIEEQLAVFAQMSLDEQRHFVLYSLSEADDTAKTLNSIVSAWRTGDTEALDRLASAEFKDFPDLNRRLITERNRKWLPTITRLLSDNGDYLVVVGAMHLAGTDGIVKLLQNLGYKVVQH